MSQHVVPVRIYLAVFAALLVLTFATVAASTVNLGDPEVAGVVIPVNMVVALAIACVKALLVVLFFMHVKYSGRLVQLVVASAFVWLSLLVVLTLSDYLTRGWQLGRPV
jgi:cytochrome c oxidase subunit IV